MMRILAARTAIGLAAAAMFISASAQALGLGEVEVRSRLNERFAAAIPVVSASEADLDSLVIELASPEAFARSGVDRADAVSGLSFVRSGNGIRVSSRDPIRDPFLTFIVEARWNGGRLLREYTVLLDPPDSAPAPSTATVIAAPTPLPLPSRPAATAGDLPGRYGPVQPNQTLWSIAKLLIRDPGISQEQMMLALYGANPQAFVGGDIDHLQKGSTLNVPTAADARAVDMATARDRVQQLRDAVPNPVQAPATAPAAPVVATAPTAAAPPASTPAPAAEPAATAAADPALPPAGAAEPVVDPAAAPAPTAEVPADPAATPAAELPPPAVEPPAPAPAPVVEAQPAPAAPVTEDSMPWPLIGGLVLLLLGLVAAKRRGRKEPAPPTARRVASGAVAEALPPGPDALMERPRPKPPVDDGAPPPVVPPLPPASDAELPPITDLDEALAGDVKTLGLGVDASDPMTEADFHLAYGLYDEAAQMLKTAIANDPERGELKVKLAEVFSAAGNAGEFRALAESLVGKATPAEWQRVSTMGRAILPDLSLFRDEPAAAAAAVAPTAPLADVLRDLSVIDFDLDTDVRRSEPVATPAPAAVEPPPPAADPLRDALMEPLEEAPLPPLGEPLEMPLLKPVPDLLPPPITLAEPIPVPAPPPAAPPAAPAPVPAAEPFAEIDLSSFDLEDDAAGRTADPGRVEFTMADLDAAASEPLVLDPESDVIGGDEIDTKLDLARAYADMGDAEAARTLLDEVLAAGNDKQRQDAQALRQRLAG